MPETTLGKQLVKRKSNGIGMRRRNMWAGVLFVLPAVGLLLVFTAWPAIDSLWISLHDWELSGNSVFIAVRNYTDAVRDPDFWNALKNTVYYTLLTVPFSMACGLGLALIVNKKIRGIAFFRAGYYLPVVTSGVAAGMIWTWIYDGQNGLLNHILNFLHITGPDWLNDPTWAMPAVILMSVWKSSGYIMVIYLAGLQGIDNSLYEAGAIDGVSRWTSFRYITLPSLAPTTLFVSIMSMIDSFKAFEQIYAMTGGGPIGSTTTIVYFAYNEAFNSYKLGYASAIAFLFFIVVFALTILQWRFSSEDSKFI